MRYWYAYTGESLIVGHARTIRRLAPHTQTLQRLLDAAGEHHSAVTARHARQVDADTFVAAMVAPLAVQEWGGLAPPATAFASVGQVARLFDGLNIERAAVNLFNGRIASAYAQGDAGMMAGRVAQGFDDGELLAWNRDSDRLHAQEVMDALPGALAFLLSESQAQRKAFSHYLRRGMPPVLSAQARKELATSRPVPRTWEREARLSKEGTVQ